MNDLIPDKQAYQLNKRRMAWTALDMMIVSTIAVLIDHALLNNFASGLNHINNQHAGVDR